MRHQRRAEVGLRSPLKTRKIQSCDTVAERTEESPSAPSFMHLEVLKEIFLMFQQQFGGGFQKFPSFCDPQGGAPSVPQHSRVCDVQVGLPRNGRKPRRPLQIQSSHEHQHLQTLISLCHSWTGGGPACVRMPSLKLFVFTVGREKSSKPGIGVSPAVQGDGSSGGLSAPAQPCCVPLNWGPGESTAAPSQPPLWFLSF